MRIAIIGRTRMLYDLAKRIHELGHEIVLIVTSKEAPEYEIKAEDFRKLAEDWGVPFWKTSKIDNPERVEKLRDFAPLDLAVSINYTGVIGESVTSLFKHGILNAHGGDLPRYRGNACQAWAIINGESRIGLCVHRMVGGELDSGAILARDFFPLTLDSRVGEVYKWMDKACGDLMVEAISALSEDPDFVLEIQSKDPADALRCYPRMPEDGKIDWKQSNVEVLRLINASSEPFAGAFTDYMESTMIVWRARLYEDGEEYLAVPGQVAAIKPEGVIVICGKGKLIITEVTYEGTRMNPSGLIKSIRRRLK